VLKLSGAPRASERQKRKAELRLQLATTSPKPIWG